MERFLYNKYAIKRIYEWDRYNLKEQYETYQTSPSSGVSHGGGAYLNYDFNKDTGTFTLRGWAADMDEIGNSTYYVSASSSRIRAYRNYQPTHDVVSRLGTPIKGTHSGTTTSESSSAYPSNGISGSYWYVSKSYRNTRGAFIESIEADEGTYPDNGIQGNYWYVRGDLANAVPWISGVDEHKGGLVKGFTYVYQVDDADLHQELTITTNFDGAVTTIRNALRKTDYEFVITPEMFNQLELGVDYTITITVADGSGAKAIRRITFKRINSAPNINIVNKKLGVQNEPFTIEYSVSDLENDVVNVEFSHKGRVLDTIVNVTLDTQQSWTIDNWDFVQIFNGNNAILVKATDVHGSSSTDVAEFTKEVYGCEIVDYENVDRICDYIIVEAHHDLYEKIDTGEIELLELQVTNNFNDENPVWEDIELGKVHTFTNKIVSGIPAIGVRYKILADPQYGDSYFYSFTYHWGWTS